MRKVIVTTLTLVACIHLFGQYNIKLLSNKTYTGQNLSGSWGYTDTVHNKEYALVGTTKGLSIVDITTPASPVEVKFINGKPGTWRECQTWKNYAYITQDNDTTNSEGVLIYDLNQIPAGKADTFRGSGPNNVVLRCHSLFIDEKGFLYLNGGRVNINGTGNNGTEIYDLNANPRKPVFVGYTPSLSGTSNEYVHDCYVRNDTMFQAHIYNTRFTVWDVRNRANPVKIQDFSTAYPTIHNMWLSDNSKTLFVTHEQFNLPMEAYDISDLTNIKQICEFRVSPTNQEIGHNVHVLNDYIIASYYSDGVAIFDASDPKNVITIGYYDTHPTTTRTENGVWGAYGFYKSGVISLSDMSNGLFVVQPTYIRAARIQGTVRDTNTLQPIVNAKISFVDTAISALSSVDGFYKTGTPKAGTFNFKAEKSGYITKFFTAVMVNGKIDSVDIKLRQYPVHSTVNDTFCQGRIYTLPDGVTVSAPGTYSSDIVLPSGKDSIIKTILKQKNSSASSFQTVFCPGTTYDLPSGKKVSSAGTYHDTIPNAAGCDSIITVLLSALPVSGSSKIANICQGQTYNLPGGNSTTTSGIYRDTLSNSFGCDSVITSYVYVNPVYTYFVLDTIIQGNTYILPNGNPVTTSGVYPIQLSSAFGCDSIVTVYLEVLDSATITGIRNHSMESEVRFTADNHQLNIISTGNSAVKTLQIYNSAGILVRSFEFPGNKIELSTLPKDIYIVKALTVNNRSHIGKIFLN